MEAIRFRKQKIMHLMIAIFARIIPSHLTKGKEDMKGLSQIAIQFFVSFSILLWSSISSAQNAFDTDVMTILKSHYTNYKEKEFFSGMALSIYIPQKPIQNYYFGQTSHTVNSPPISSDTLFQIGSITKSFTAAIILQLEKEKKLTIENDFKDWLAQYNKWPNIKIKNLLNMTSGLPNYSDAPLWNAEIYNNPTRIWTDEAILDSVYPIANFTPPLKPGYFYTNTAYILASLIIEKATKNSFKNELINRLLKPLKLKNTFYTVPQLDKAVQARLARGYFYDQYVNPKLVGHDVSDINLSVAGAAGAIISNTEDMIKWVKALFVDNQILDAAQKKKLVELVSVKTGKPLINFTNEDPSGFGLAVMESQVTNKKIGQLQFFSYQGVTFGFRAIYFYFPCNGVIISCAFNSATNGANDHGSELVLRTYDLILKRYPNLSCKGKH